MHNRNGTAFFKDLHTRRGLLCGSAHVARANYHTAHSKCQSLARSSHAYICRWQKMHAKCLERFRKRKEGQVLQDMAPWYRSQLRAEAGKYLLHRHRPMVQPRPHNVPSIGLIEVISDEVSPLPQVVERIWRMNCEKKDLPQHFRIITRLLRYGKSFSTVGSWKPLWESLPLMFQLMINLVCIRKYRHRNVATKPIAQWLRNWTSVANVMERVRNKRVIQSTKEGWTLTCKGIDSWPSHIYSSRGLDVVSLHPRYVYGVLLDAH